MATKKKPFDAVVESRRWRRTTSRLLNKMTAEEQIAFLNRRLKDWPVTSASKLARELAHR
ncbi:MAG: hypothetical protein HZA93_11665 [Verrucomicrobia bacterium]|nr:hypothetical protein [Verrucomicrobiota bacterium]